MQFFCRVGLPALLLTLSASAQIVPGRYIVELSEPPVADKVQGKPGLKSSAASSRLARVRAQQADVRSRLSDNGVTVLESVNTVANALIVDAPDASALASLPGVQKVYPVRRMKLLLDRAVQLHHVTDVWNHIGVDHAGAGVKIGIIDTGVDNSHPGLRNSSLTPPQGFPLTDPGASAFTNGKVVVARSYVSLLDNRDPDTSPRDRVGHGTALAMIAGGVRTAGPLATITGVAPEAWIGNYKVFGSPGVNDDSTDAAIIKAMDDAVADGMDVISLSVGSDIAPRMNDDPEIAAIERATAAGVIVVVAAGNNGPDLDTISSPATSPSAVSVGASTSDRLFATSVQFGDVASAVGVLGDGPRPASDISAPAFDLSTLGGDDQACSAIDGSSLQGRIVLVRRGVCTFETKLNNLQSAGAVAAIVSALADSPEAFEMSVGGATLPSQMVSYGAGQALRAALAENPDLSATMHLELTAVPTTPNLLSSFSADGPSVDLGIKPDITAVGVNFYTATQSFDTQGEMYDPSGFISVNGTSFSTPFVAGIAALLKSARPGLTVDQYRSLLVNTAHAMTTADGQAVKIQTTGAGLVDAFAALNSNTTVTPVSISFGSGTSDASFSRTLSVQNLGSSDETWAVTVDSACGQTPSVNSGNTLTIAAGQTGSLGLSFSASGLPEGACEGALVLQAASSGATVRVPWWYAVASSVPYAITTLDLTDSGRRGRVIQDAVLFRITDSAGLPITSVQPEVNVLDGNGTVVRINEHDADIPGMFGIDVRLGSAAGTNTFEIRAGDAHAVVSITGN